MASNPEEAQVPRRAVEPMLLLLLLLLMMMIMIMMICCLHLEFVTCFISPYLLTSFPGPTNPVKRNM
jgi:hypothetical protein